MADHPRSKDPNGPGAANTSGYPTDPPPYSGYPPGPPPTQTVHMVTVVPRGVVIQQTVGADPTHTTCKSCHAAIVTRVERKATTRTHIMAALLCLFGCWPCVCIPYCTASCLNTDHYCTNCGAFIGTYIR